MNRAWLRAGGTAAGLLLLGALLLAPRVANWRDVFVEGEIYFVDGDCYARMTRARLCAEAPGTIVRHHDFENFPVGTAPHTTAPLDYMIVALATVLRPFRADGLDQAGAWISPLLALLTGYFLWWWAAAMKLRSRWPMLLLYATSAIIVHAGSLGRPDHHQLSLSLVAVAIAAELRLGRRTLGAAREGDIGGQQLLASNTRWSVVAGAAWALALWVTLYEPFVLLVGTVIFHAVANRQQLLSRERRSSWIVFVVVLIIAAVIERRLPVFSVSDWDLFRRWSRAIEELTPIPILDRIWLEWTGFFVPLALGLAMWCGFRRRWTPPLLLVLLFVSSLALSFWQARWAYFAVLFLSLLLPFLFEKVRSRWITVGAVGLAIFPIVQGWDRQLWPSEAEMSRRVQTRSANVDLRALALQMHSAETGGFIAPWWMSAAVAYWSRQPGLAGSSHESLPGNLAAARFYLADDISEASAIARERRAQWVLSGNADWVLENSAQVAGSQASNNSLGLVLDRWPSRAPNFLRLVGQKNEGKLYKVAIFR